MFAFVTVLWSIFFSHFFKIRKAKHARWIFMPHYIYYSSIIFNHCCRDVITKSFPSLFVLCFYLDHEPCFNILSIHLIEQGSVHWLVFSLKINRFDPFNTFLGHNLISLCQFPFYSSESRVSRCSFAAHPNLTPGLIIRLTLTVANLNLKDSSDGWLVKARKMFIKPLII